MMRQPDEWDEALTDMPSVRRSRLNDVLRHERARFFGFASRELPASMTS